MFPDENTKSEHHHWILHIWISLCAKFQDKLTIFIFLDQICPKTVFPFWNRKSEHHHWIPHAWISLGAKVQLKLTVLNFWTKFALYAALASLTADQIFSPKIRKIWKYYLFTNYIQKRDQKSEIFEWIQKNVSGEKRQFQYVLLK